MNIYVTSAIAGLKEKLSAYVSLLNYRYINLCVKADVASLLPVTVIADKEYNLEDVAQIATPDDYQLDVYPKQIDYLQPIIEGIFDVHPEFKMEIQQVEYSEDKRDKHLLYTMPEVNKERYDLLTSTAKVFYEECNMEIDKECALHTASLPELAGKMPIEDIQEIEDVLEHTINEYHDKTKELRQEKLIEIEEAYQRYLANKEGNEWSDDEIDFTKCMRLGQVEE
jgi:hypothetical protein